MKTNIYVILTTLLLTAFYVVSVQRAVGGQCYLHRVEPQMLAPAEARMATVTVDSGGRGEGSVTVTPKDSTVPLYCVPRLIGK